MSYISLSGFIQNDIQWRAEQTETIENEQSHSDTRSIGISIEFTKKTVSGTIEINPCTCIRTEFRIKSLSDTRINVVAKLKITGENKSGQQIPTVRSSYFPILTGILH